MLRNIYHPPETLYYKGQLPLPDEKLIAIVGTRKATTNGKRAAEKIGQELAECGMTVVSGLALGIDGAAHKGALLGGGKTVVVLGRGVDEIYPREHSRLGEEILSNGGCIMSEYKPETPTFPNQFLERNRIVSGLSIGVIIIEAPLKSGALSTTRHALEQGREVFVVPGPVDSFNYRGSHMLLREGARLVTSAKEILDDLGFDMIENKNTKRTRKINPEENKIIEELFRRGTLSINGLAKETGMKLPILNSSLGSLVLDDIIEEAEGKFTLK